MAKLPPKKQEENTGEWLNTYADMVTLLLTFFVLLFACSNMDETKIQYIFQAFRVNGRYVNTVVTQPNESQESEGSGNSESPDNKGGEGELPQSFDTLYTYLSEYIADKELGESVSLDQGAAHITIRFDDNVFFDGDSYRLKKEGKEVLDGIIPGLRAVEKSIQNIYVTGHTAYVPNPTMSVWMLSSMRAVSVVDYLDLKETVDNTKYACYGYGPNRPIADNTTADGKRKNRRVELLILRNKEELDMNDPEVIKDQLEHEFSLKTQKYDPMDEPKVDPNTLPEGSAERIVAEIDKFYNDAGVTTGIYGPGAISDEEFIITPEDEGKETGGSSE